MTQMYFLSREQVNDFYNSQPAHQRAKKVLNFTPPDPQTRFLANPQLASQIKCRAALTICVQSELSHHLG